MNFFGTVSGWLSRLLGKPAANFATPESFAKDYGIEVISESHSDYGDIKHVELDPIVIKPAYRLIQNELQIYSKRTIKATNLSRIVLAANVRHHDKSVGGLCVAQQGLLYLGADRLSNWNGSRRTFHHELFHCLDYHDDDWKYYDPEWAALNEKSFAYASNGGRKSAAIPRLGFVSNYAMTAVHEDKAELFSHLIVHNRTTIDMAGNDKILSAKIDHLKTIVARACPDIDTSFWQQRLAHSVLPEQIKSELIMSLRVWREKTAAGELWFLARSDNPVAKPISFHSPEQLMDAMHKLGVAEWDEIKNISHGNKVELKLKTTQTILNDLGLH